MNHVLFNQVVDGVVVDGPMPYQTVVTRTGFTDTVSFAEAGYVEHFEPQPEIIITQQQHLVAVRARRDNLLEQSDWTQRPDNNLSAEEKAKWEVYRQLLRDVPQNIDYTIDHPLDVTMPQTPA